MNSDLVEFGWSEDQWNRISGAVTEEAQRARVAAQMLPLVGPEDPSTVAIPNFTLLSDRNLNPPPTQRLSVDSFPWLPITTIAVNVPLRTHEMADPELKAALGMFRRAANYIARIEDALVFNGRDDNQIPGVAEQMYDVHTISNDGRDSFGIIMPTELNRWDARPGHPPQGDRKKRIQEPLVPRDKKEGLKGDEIVTAIIKVIGDLDAAGHQGPYACALSQDLFARICTPTDNLVLPRDRILPFLQGPLLRSAAIQGSCGAVVALSGNPVELVVASDLSVRYLLTTPEPRSVFRVSERVALRIKEESAIAILRHT